MIEYGGWGKGEEGDIGVSGSRLREGGGVRRAWIERGGWGKGERGRHRNRW